MIMIVENVTLELTNNSIYPQLLFKALIYKALLIFTIVIYFSHL